jgi:Cu(I)/Ag(I) efflux system membrane protein CusA/SilA
MHAAGVNADIMSLGGIAIAIGAMIDAAIVMIENMHKHLERAVPHDPGTARFDTGALTAQQRWQIVLDASREVGPSLFFSLLVITVSFLPVFTLQGEEGRLFTPLAFTKTFAMASASLLSVTLVPVAMGLFVRGRIYRERANPINRWLIRLYRPIIDAVLRHRLAVVTGAAALLVLTWIPWSHMGSEFMPPLYEGSLLYMPTTLPGISVARAREMLQVEDSILKSFPEVEHVFGKTGRANTATDPAGLDMTETTITLKPESEWPRGMTHDRLIAAMNSAVRTPGIVNAWTMPIKGRMDMLATGIRTPVGVKIFGPDLDTLQRIGQDIERVAEKVPGTRSAFAERAVSGYYVDIKIDREKAARLGLNIGDVQSVIAAAIGGMSVTQTVEGRERYAVRVRYPQELRDTPERLAEVLVPVAHQGSRPPGMTPASMVMPAPDQAGGPLPTMAERVSQVPLGEVATIHLETGPMVVRTENATPTAWVYLDVAGTDLGTYVRDAQAAVDRAVKLPPGYRLEWSGEYEYMQRARARMTIVVPATLAIIFLLLFLNFRTVGDSLLVMVSLPFALVGGLWFVWGLGYNWSVAVAIGFIALAGVAAETGVVMLIYLNQAWEEHRAKGAAPTVHDLYAAVIEGAVDRVRPKMMTVVAIMAGLLPILWGNGTGASVMKRIAAPMVGGMVSSTVLTLVVIPALYSWWKEWELRRAGAAARADVSVGSLVLGAERAPSVIHPDREA